MEGVQGMAGLETSTKVCEGFCVTGERFGSRAVTLKTDGAALQGGGGRMRGRMAVSKVTGYNFKRL